MGLFSSNEDDDESTDEERSESTFRPVTCDGSQVLGYYRETAESDPQLVWVSNIQFDRIDVEDIDTIDMPE